MISTTFDTFFTLWKVLNLQKLLVLSSRESTSGQSGLWESMFQS